MQVYSSGTIINNRYEVVLGPKEKRSLAGGMGLVYLCVDHAEDGKPVALKTFRPELLSNRAARDRFLREGTTLVEFVTLFNSDYTYNQQNMRNHKEKIF